MSDECLEKKKKSRNRRVYDCEHFEFEYDDWGKYAWCHCMDNPDRECMVEWKTCIDLCPFYKKKKGSYRMFEYTKTDEYLRKEFKEKLADKFNEVERRFASLTNELKRYTNAVASYRKALK